MTDVIVVGGGPAGASLAIALGRRGIDVELYDQASFPRDKPCGEGLLPAGLAVLRSLDLADAVAGQPLRGVRYHLTGGSLRSGFADALHGIGQRRVRLDATLWAAAARTPHVRAHAGTRVDEVILERGQVSGVRVDGESRRARLVVAADGSHSKLRRQLGLDRIAAPRRVGIRAHFQRPRGCAPLSDIEIFFGSGYELYVTPLPNDELLVAALAHEQVAARDLRGAFQRWLEHQPMLRNWLESATQVSELMGRAPLVTHARAPAPTGLVFLGDAAASVDPITAGGLSLALRSAELLAQHTSELLSGSALARRRFERARARTVRVHRWLGAGVLALAGSPRLAELARRAFGVEPRALQALLTIAGGT